jgi:hypothetical protein
MATASGGRQAQGWRTELFREHAKSLPGYDVANTGAVIFNARR